MAVAYHKPAADDLSFKLLRSIELQKEINMAKKRVHPSKLEQHRAVIKVAMPDVEAVVKQHGLSIVHSCVSKIYEKNKLKKKAESLRKQIEEIEGQL